MNAQTILELSGQMFRFITLVLPVVLFSIL